VNREGAAVVTRVAHGKCAPDRKSVITCCALLRWKVTSPLLKEPMVSAKKPNVCVVPTSPYTWPLITMLAMRDMVPPAMAASLASPKVPSVVVQPLSRLLAIQSPPTVTVPICALPFRPAAPAIYASQYPRLLDAPEDVDALDGHVVFDGSPTRPSA
jgi:hypothetical protein